MSIFPNEAQRLLRRTGSTGAIGIALLAGSAVFYTAMVLPLRQESTQLINNQKELHRSALKMKRGKAAAPPTSESQLAEFYGFFPRFDSIDEQVAKIYAVAKHQNINLANGEYKLAEDAVGKLYRYQITLPLNASQVQISRFLAEIMAEIPALSLDDISLKRETIGTPTVNARLRLTLFLGRSE